jgi:rhomboid protease GluP
MHLLINSVFIFYFGSKLEKFIKGWEFLVIAFGSSIFAGLFTSLMSLIKGSDTITVGSSGMVYGIIGSLVIYSKLTRKPMHGLSDISILIFFLIGIAFSISNELVNIGTHIGGFIGGIIITLIVLRNYKSQVQAEVE